MSPEYAKSKEAKEKGKRKHGIRTNNNSKPLTTSPPSNYPYSTPRSAILSNVPVHLQTIWAQERSDTSFHCTRNLGTLTRVVEHKVEDEILQAEQWRELFALTHSFP
jgi:hypothetical protein